MILTPMEVSSCTQNLCPYFFSSSLHDQKHGIIIPVTPPFIAFSSDQSKFWFFFQISSFNVSLMLFSLMGLLQIYVSIAVMVLVAELSFTESGVVIHFLEAPRAHSRVSIAVFKYWVERDDGSNACIDNGCSFYYELDDQTLRPCPADIIELKNLTVNREHKLFLHVQTSKGEKNSSAYSWFVDTIPPTATLFTQQNYTNAEKIAIDVTFSEACTGLGGFKCTNSSNCDVIINGPAYAQASSLRVIKPSIQYSLNVIISLKIIYGRVVIRMADNICMDQAGNHFTKTNGSVIIIHFDRRPVLVDLWTSVPSYELRINKVPRTVLATNKFKDLKIFLDFSIPVVNSTEQILHALHVSSGNFSPIQIRNHGNHGFVFEIRNISRTEILTVELQSGLVIGKTGTPVSPVSSLTFLYDSTRPRVGLSTNSPSVTKDVNIKVIVEFTKPVFGFDSSSVVVEGGRLTRIQELSRALYSLTILAVPQNVVSVTVPARIVNDVSGNLNLASNRIQVKHYSTPAISLTLHLFVTAGTLATSLAAGALSLSSSNLRTISSLGSGSCNDIADISTNLHGMIGHLQVFVLSDWLSVNPPIEYSETTKGLRWLIPRQKLPWKKNIGSIWPEHFYFDEEKLSRKFSSFPSGFPSHGRARDSVDFNVTKPHELPIQTEVHPRFDWLHGKHNMGIKDIPYGLPFRSDEYFTYFLRGEPLSATNVIKRMENYKGWQDLEMNLFWLGIGGGSLLIIHLLILLLLRLRTGSRAHAILSVPGFEILLLIVALPCISQASAFVIRGGTTEGIITGALLLVIPTAFILSVCIFLTVVIFSGSLALYKDVKNVGTKEPWYAKLWFFFTGWPAAGKWFYKGGLPSSFLPRFGILFASQKGPAFFVFVDENDPNTMPKWIESGQSGIGRMRAVRSVDSNEEISIPASRTLLGCARSSYIILDLLRRIILGTLSGACSSQKQSQSIIALTVTLVQFIYLFTFKPYIRRKVHMVESISLLCEASIFALSITTNGSSQIKGRHQGFVMLALLYITFLSHLINEWYTMMKFLLRLSHPRKKSFKLGLKLAAKGLILPFLPRHHWLKIIPGSSEPKTGLAPVLPLSPETELQRRDTRVQHVAPLRAMTATVVPVHSPRSPSVNVIPSTSATEDRQRGKAPKFKPKSELKKLRELAKASFPGVSKSEEGSTSSYACRIQSMPETCFDIPRFPLHKSNVDLVNLNQM